MRAMWPVISADVCHTLADLFLEASTELPQIARRNKATLASPPRWLLMPGRQMQGSGGAPFIIVSDSAAFLDPIRKV